MDKKEKKGAKTSKSKEIRKRTGQMTKIAPASRITLYAGGQIISKHKKGGNNNQSVH